jgi:SSS family solute:Na+ symporter
VELRVEEHPTRSDVCVFVVGGTSLDSNEHLAACDDAEEPAVFIAQESILRLDATAIDYLIIALYFTFVLGIGYLAKRAVSNSLDFFLSGRSLPAWVTGLAFISANLGAIEIMGMSANGAQYGMPTVHYFWIGAIPAMLFLGIVMMPFY